jgi:ATP-dependent DNA helicase DinG
MSEVESALASVLSAARGLGERVTVLCEPAATHSEDSDEGAYAPELRGTEEVRTWASSPGSSGRRR